MTLARFNPRWALAFLTPPLHTCAVPLYPFWVIFLLEKHQLLFNCLNCEVFAHPCRSPAVFSWISIRVDKTSACGKWSFQINEIFRTFLLSHFNVSSASLYQSSPQPLNRVWVITISLACSFIPSLKLSSPDWPPCWQRLFTPWYLLQLVMWMVFLSQRGSQACKRLSLLSTLAVQWFVNSEDSSIFHQVLPSHWKNEGDASWAFGPLASTSNVMSCSLQFRFPLRVLVPTENSSSGGIIWWSDWRPAALDPNSWQAANIPRHQTRPGDAGVCPWQQSFPQLILLLPPDTAAGIRLSLPRRFIGHSPSPSCASWALNPHWSCRLVGGAGVILPVWEATGFQPLPSWKSIVSSDLVYSSLKAVRCLHLWRFSQCSSCLLCCSAWWPPPFQDQEWAANRKAPFDQEHLTELVRLELANQFSSLLLPFLHGSRHKNSSKFS